MFEVVYLSGIRGNLQISRAYHFQITERKLHKYPFHVRLMSTRSPRSLYIVWLNRLCHQGDNHTLKVIILYRLSGLHQLYNYQIEVIPFLWFIYCSNRCRNKDLLPDYAINIYIKFHISWISGLHHLLVVTLNERCNYIQIMDCTSN